MQEVRWSCSRVCWEGRQAPMLQVVQQWGAMNVLLLTLFFCFLGARVWNDQTPRPPRVIFYGRDPHGLSWRESSTGGGLASGVIWEAVGSRLQRTKLFYWESSASLSLQGWQPLALPQQQEQLRSLKIIRLHVNDWLAGGWGGETVLEITDGGANTEATDGVTDVKPHEIHADPSGFFPQDIGVNTLPLGVNTLPADFSGAALRCTPSSTSTEGTSFWGGLDAEDEQAQESSAMDCLLSVSNGCPAAYAAEVTNRYSVAQG
ncbi:hypothetical protein cyc_00374 [Cyclospora cayetanensis]|uniref:Uncharacterized protein n=1 Tax=Cyclospora cayetanensis TaxID=88456 RepID=A0A1D3CXT6_9EIME|nr:hypothetical protein cyc_00374 [Cyclospora cayetanensis]